MALRTHLIAGQWNAPAVQPPPDALKQSSDSHLRSLRGRKKIPPSTLTPLLPASPQGCKYERWSMSLPYCTSPYQRTTRGVQRPLSSPGRLDSTSLSLATFESGIRGDQGSLQSPGWSDVRSTNMTPATSEQTVRGYKWTLQSPDWSGVRNNSSTPAINDQTIHGFKWALQHYGWADARNNNTIPAKCEPVIRGGQRSLQFPSWFDVKNTTISHDGEDSASGSLCGTPMARSPISFTTSSPVSCTSDSSGVSSLEHSQPENQWHEPKSEIIYQRRDILDLASNMRGYFGFQFAQLPRRNVQMFLANRSQYDRLSWEDSLAYQDEVECLACNFKFMRPSGGWN